MITFPTGVAGAGVAGAGVVGAGVAGAGVAGAGVAGASFKYSYTAAFFLKWADFLLSMNF